MEMPEREHKLDGQRQQRKPRASFDVRSEPLHIGRRRDRALRGDVRPPAALHYNISGIVVGCQWRSSATLFASDLFEKVWVRCNVVARDLRDLPGQKTGTRDRTDAGQALNYLAAMSPGGSAKLLIRSLMSLSVCRLVSMAPVGISCSTSDAMESRRLSRSSTS